MKPIPFPEQNMIVAKDQSEYIPLPSLRIPGDPKGQVVFCMGLSIWERCKLLFTGRIWCILMQFTDQDGKPNPVTPSYFSVNKKDVLISDRKFSLFHFMFGFLMGD